MACMRCSCNHDYVHTALPLTVTVIVNNQQQGGVMKQSYSDHSEVDYFPVMAHPRVLFLLYKLFATNYNFFY